MASPTPTTASDVLTCLDMTAFDSHFGPREYDSIIHAKRNGKEDDILDSLDCYSMWNFIIYRNFRLGDIFGMMCSTILWYALLWISPGKSLNKKDLNEFYQGTLFTRIAEGRFDHK